jgi:glyoxylase-like metal-dependent hydrolase (beta-lactamase superfamily II)
MQGDDIPFDMLSGIGEEVAIPPRYTNWQAGEPAKGKHSAKTAGQVLVEIFLEMAGNQVISGRALVAVYKLAPNPLVKTSNGRSDRVVICIEHPVHWAMVEAKAKAEGYQLSRLFAVHCQPDHIIGLASPHDCRLRHLRSSSDYKQKPRDLEMIEALAAKLRQPAKTATQPVAPKK